MLCGWEKFGSINDNLLLNEVLNKVSNEAIQRTSASMRDYNKTQASFLSKDNQILYRYRTIYS